MQCCQPSTGAAARFFSWFARRSGRHYRKRGLGKQQRQLVSSVRETGIEGSSLLEIGCGVGYLHQALLKSGAGTALGVDLSEKMISEARVLAAEQSLADRTNYVQGDFVAIAPDLPDADITILDKVVCCYPDAKTLIERSLEKTGRVYALTYPRAHFLNRLVTEVEAFCLKIIGCDFRPYIHNPGDIDARIQAQGFRKRAEHVNWIWLAQVYCHK